MRIIKRLYGFILKSFIPLFAMTFFIVLFIVLMQFLWKYIDDLVGKGLGISVIGELFFYAAVSMVPMALPLAILLASLMTFGNFGEKFELTAMKASGVSLLKAMSPLIVLISGIAVGAFFFQNDVLPHAQVKMWTLLFSMRQKSPELEIPEGVFYDQIPGYNLFVERKNRDTGMLYKVMIYDVSKGGDNSTILVADSGRLAFTPDMRYLYLHLFQGEQFENLREQRSMDKNVPFRRETFLDKEVLIPFDANFNRLDEGGMRKQYVGKNIDELRHTIDSIGLRLDSTGNIYASDLRRNAFPNLRENESPRVSSKSAHSSKREEAKVSLKDSVYAPLSMDSLLRALNPTQRSQVFDAAESYSIRAYNEQQFKALSVSDDKRTMRRHQIELLKKFTLSVACLIFFFIGAPLGAIIRKGGLGTPLVISVLLFLVYYIIDNTGYKMARDGHWIVWCGIWLSTFILAPLGVYVTYKAMNDSAVFDPDRYKSFIRKILGIKVDRSVAYKEIIINDISTEEAVSRLYALSEECKAFCDKYSHRLSYKQYWLSGYPASRINEISAHLEEDVDYMTNCRDSLAVNKLMDYPIVRNLWLYHPSSNPLVAKIILWLFPIGVPVYFVGLRVQKGLKDELRKISAVSRSIINILDPSFLENK
ncbi:MAG: LptF/LptG family permease [Muribaculaceae bacterium]|nr:LptF/LptG family permease [Muribaculaceae bacterium]